MTDKKLSLKNYIGYGLCDFANNIAFCVMSSYLSVYCTDILKIQGWVVSAIMIAARIWDGINDPIMGFLAQSHKPGKNGKYKPFIVTGGYPLAVSAVLVFLQFSDNVTFNTVWVTATYILYGMLYTVVLVPYGSLANVMTTKANERNFLSMSRSLGGAAGSLPGLVFPFFVMTAGGDGNQMDASRLRISMVAIAVLMIINYTLGYKLTTETVYTGSNAEKISITATLKSVIKNRAFVTMSIIGCMVIASQMYTGTVNIYLFKDYFEDSRMSIVYTMVSYAPMAVLILFANKLIEKFGKKEIFTVGFAISTVAALLTYILQPGKENLWLFIFLAIFVNCGTGFMTLEIWGCAGDIIDCNEWITGRREEAPNYALFTFMRKIGQAIAAFAPWFVSLAGYDAELAGSGTQSAEALDGMYKMATGVPCVMYLIMLIMAILYPLNKKTTDKMHAELDVARSRYNTETI